MRLLLIGCEYTGKSTLAGNISRWMIETMGVSLVRWHDHFVVPRLDSHTIIRAEGSDAAIGKAEHDLNTDDDEEQIMSLRPNVLEQLQRHNIWRHLHPGLLSADDVLFINFYYAEAVYAPLYYGYGEPGSFADRSERAREWDQELRPLRAGHGAGAPNRRCHDRRRAHGSAPAPARPRHPQRTRYPVRPRPLPR